MGLISGLTLLLFFQLLGEIIARSLDWPIPGPVIGMVLLFIMLVMRRGPGDTLQSSSQHLLQHLSLLFIPAGTGIMVHFDLVKDEWLPLLVALFVSTLLSLVVTALVMNWFRPSHKAEE